jgi:oligopeptidase A
MAQTSSPLRQGQGLPEFGAITSDQVKQDIPVILKQVDEAFTAYESRLEAILTSQTALDWATVMGPLQEFGERLRWSWGVVSHLNGVCNSSELRTAHAEQQPEVVRLGNRLGQSQVLHSALTRLQESPVVALTPTQSRILRSELLSMQHRGVGLRGDDKAKFNEASERLAALSTQFGNHVLDATQQWTLKLTSREEVAGLPQRALEALASAAKEAGDSAATAEAGPWLLGLDMPRYLPFLTHANNRSVRETAYRAHVGRASSGEHDNRALIEEILSLRGQQATRLGYAHWADVSLASKMAKDVDAVEGLLEELRVAAFPAAERELDDLKALAQRHGAAEATNSPLGISRTGVKNYAKSVLIWIKRRCVPGSHCRRFLMASLASAIACLMW